METSMTKLVAFSILFATSAASAESLEERTYWRGQLDDISPNLADAEEYCGVKLTFELVGKPTLREGAKKDAITPKGICDDPIDEVIKLCRTGDDEKAAVAAKLKGFTCGYDKSRKLDVKSGIVVYRGNTVQPRFSDWARAILLEKL